LAQKYQEKLGKGGVDTTHALPGTINPSNDRAAPDQASVVGKRALKKAKKKTKKEKKKKEKKRKRKRSPSSSTSPAPDARRQRKQHRSRSR
jgi:hypothetical protein